MRNIVLVSLCSMILFSSCVTSKKYKSLETDYYGLRNRYENLGVLSNEQASKIKSLEGEIADLKEDIEALTSEKEALIRRNKDLNELQDKLQNSNQKEIADLLKKLQQNEDSLQKKEDELRERNKKLLELQDALAKNEQAVKALKSKVADALLGFEGKGLTVHQKNGKVYVSVDEKLLFKSGSYEIERPGEEALAEIRKVLEQNTEINIMVEGHTDNVRYAGSGSLSDNWDLSVKRATTVARTLLKGGKVEPSRVTAAGRGEYIPIAENTTKEGRQKNRRTEIILTPKLDELLEMIQ
ncbi:MAG: OmpA family protein [Prevotellaceae bacterium]|nr:OmpA family protein [Prevotellaceae bacterium]